MASLLDDEISVEPTPSNVSESCCTVQYIHSTYAVWGNAMATEKTTTITFRIEPKLKDALRTAAELEHRSIANMIEVMIRDHCARSGIAIPDQSNSPVGRKAAATNRK